MHGNMQHRQRQMQKSEFQEITTKLKIAQTVKKKKWVNTNKNNAMLYRNI